MSFWNNFWPRKKEYSHLKNALTSQKTQVLFEKYLQIKQPTKNTLLKDIQLIAVDFETTGLDSKSDEILSMGFCPINNFKIRLADCIHIIIKPTKSLKSDNVVIHGLTDDQVNKGVSAEQAMVTFLELVKGKVIVAHYHSIEKNFIQKLAKQVLGRSIPISLFDTYMIAEQRMLRRDQVVGSGSLRLFNLRKDLGLPNYNAHNALEDAISTAELFLAQVASLNMPIETIKSHRLGLLNYSS